MRELSVAISEGINRQLLAHLLRGDGQEDLAFALWTPSDGAHRRTAIVNAVVLPQEGDHQVHGNASFNADYVERVLKLAMERRSGVAFLHSHLTDGWQHMSNPDIVAEQELAGPVAAMSALPLVGMTVGTDGTWSARIWERSGPKQYQRNWCRSVRTVGEQLHVSFAPELAPIPRTSEMLRRTINVWGEENHTRLQRLRIGIVGLGSVGSIVAEQLARIGMTRFVLIDFDEVQLHNLDRLMTATRDDVGHLKVDVAERRIRRVATADDVDVSAIAYSIAEEPGYRAALDCDVLFSCVDRPRARSILNHLAYAHLIPVIDGGISVRFKPVRFKPARFTGADWQAQTVAPGRPCLQCLGAFDIGDAETERAGMLDDPSYMSGLPVDHHLKQNENVFPFSASLASMEVLQFVALTTGLAGWPNLGVQRYRSIPGMMERLPDQHCRDDCPTPTLIGEGDRHFSLFSRDPTAEAARDRQNEGAGQRGDDSEA
ncbi:MAG: ThiF family adenylyltransferase [Byssovorax sp.]